MKLLVLLSLAAFCNSVPTNRKYVVGWNGEDANFIDQQLVHGNEELSYNPLYNVLGSWKQPANQWINHGDVSDSYGHYWNQWLAYPMEHTEDVVYPWVHKYWSPTELNNLTPVQRVHLLLNYIQQRKYWNQWNNDVTDEVYLHKMLAQYLPEQYHDVQFTEEQLVPQLVKYFEQYPLKYHQVMQSVVQTQWTFEQILKYLVQEIYENYKQAPWTRDQIQEYIIEHFGHSSLTYQQLQQLVELVYHLQYQVISAMHQKTAQTQKYPWSYKHLEQTQMKPWNVVFYNLDNKMKLNKQEYEQVPWINQQWEHIGNKPWVHFSNLNKKWLPNIYAGNQLHQQYQQTPWNYQHWAQTGVTPLTQYPQQWNQKWNVEKNQYVPYEHLSTWQ